MKHKKSGGVVPIAKEFHSKAVAKSGLSSKMAKKVHDLKKSQVSKKMR